MSTMTLVVDSSARPVDLVPVRHAVAHWAASLQDKAMTPFQVLATDEQRRFRSRHLDLPAPVVIMHPDYIQLPKKDSQHVSRRVLFARDKYQCQYCQRVADATDATSKLTMDHVRPAHLFASRHAATTWDNVVTACFACNQRKGGKLPMECGMYPTTTPKKPEWIQLRFAGRLNAAQQDYVDTYYQKGSK